MIKEHKQIIIFLGLIWSLKMFNVLSVQYWITEKLYYKIAKLEVFKEKKRAFVLRFFFFSFFSFCLCKTKHAINVSIVAKFRHEEALRGMKITPLAKVQHYQGSFFLFIGRRRGIQNDIPTFYKFLQKKVSRLDKRNFLHLLNECRALPTWFMQITTPKVV